MRKLFVHPAIRQYRAPLFRMLSECGVEFLFTSVNKDGTPAGEESSRLLDNTVLKFRQCKEIPLFGKRNFSFQLIGVVNYEIVIFSCATSIPFILCSLPLKLLGKKVILFDEMWMYPQSTVYRFLRPLIRFLVNSCVHSFVTAGSAATQYVLTEYEVGSRQIGTAVNTTCVDRSLAKKSGSNSASGFPDTRLQGAEFKILFLGRLVDYKGLDVLLKALAPLQISFQLLVVGDGPQMECYKSLSRILGLSKRVVFAGSCRAVDAVHWYSMADLFVHPGKYVSGVSVGYEAWGFTINEAMQCRTPVIATDAVGASKDLIIDGETGWIVPAGDVEALRSKIESVLRDEAGRARVVKAAVYHLEKTCCYEQNLKCFIEAMGVDSANSE